MLLARITYSEDMTTTGGKYLRPFHLGFRTDFGLPGMSDPVDMCTLMELVLVGGGYMFAKRASQFSGDYMGLNVFF